MVFHESIRISRILIPPSLSPSLFPSLSLQGLAFSRDSPAHGLTAAGTAHHRRDSRIKGLAVAGTRRRRDFVEL